jgi:Cdc6-like AAA superfamily ATPase
MKAGTVLGVPFDDYLTYRKKVRTHHTETAFDKEVFQRLDRLIKNCKASFDADAGLDIRGICLIGPGGTGKSTSIKYHIARMDEFKPTLRTGGSYSSNLLHVTVLPNSTTKSALIQILGMFGIDDIRKTNTEADLLQIILTQMKRAGYRYIVLDEWQHVIRSSKSGSLKKVQDLMKGFVSSPGYPLHAVFIGTDDLDPVVKDAQRQVSRRIEIWRIPSMSKRKLKRAREIIDDVISMGCGMTYDWNVENYEKASDEAKAAADTVAARILHAANYRLGNIVEFLQSTCFDAFDKGRGAITFDDLAEVYARGSGCTKAENVMLAPNYWEIDTRSEREKGSR